jgi:ABC-2 type transport system permease protein
MNMQTDAMSPIESRVAPAVIPQSRRLYWSVKRELWENRWLYLAPLAVAALFLAAFLISAIHPPRHMHVESTLSSSQPQEPLEQPYTIAALFMMGTTFIVAAFYCLDALYGERRDRSILFWKSLPVSDLTTVLAKATIPLVFLPLLTFAIIVVTQLIMVVLSSAVMLARGQSVSTLWTHLPFFQMSLGLLFHLVAIHSLWYAPIYCWLLLVSGWARRAPFLWAVLPLIAIAVVEKIAFNTSYFAAMLGNRFGGGESAGFTEGRMAMAPLAHLGLGSFFLSPGLWIGLTVAAAFLAVAVRLRRYREPI